AGAEATVRADASTLDEAMVEGLLERVGNPARIEVVVLVAVVTAVVDALLRRRRIESSLVGTPRLRSLAVVRAAVVLLAIVLRPAVARAAIVAPLAATVAAFLVLVRCVVVAAGQTPDRADVVLVEIDPDAA